MVPPFIFKSCQTERAFLQVAYIKKINPDILVLNETFMNSTRHIINDSLKEYYPYQSDITKKGFFRSNSGLWVLSKFPIYRQHFLKYRNKKGSDIFAKKGALFLEAKLPQKTIQLIATHMQSLSKYKTTRMKQFKQLKEKMLEPFFSDSIPQFLIGDLNCNYYDSTEYKSMIAILETLPVSFTGEKYSWNGIENDLANKFSEHTLETLDYILLRKQHQHLAEIQSTEILSSKYDSCYCKYNYQYISDHHAVISTIKLK